MQAETTDEQDGMYFFLAAALLVFPFALLGIPELVFRHVAKGGRDQFLERWHSFRKIAAILLVMPIAVAFASPWSPMRGWERSYWLHDLKPGDTIAFNVDRAPSSVLRGIALRNDVPYQFAWGWYPAFSVSAVRAGCHDSHLIGGSIKLDYARSRELGFSLTLVGRMPHPDLRYRMSATGNGFGCVSEILADADAIALFKMHAKMTGRYIATTPPASRARRWTADQALSVVGISFEQGVHGGPVSGWVR